jgi:hypothetical protein
VYDERAGRPTLALAATASGDGDCSDRRCWKARRRGWRLENSSGVPNGIVSLYLDAGPVDGRSRVRVRMKGPSFSVPSLPLVSDPTVQVQLRSSDPSVLRAVFSMPTKNDDLSYRAKSD